MVRDDMPNSVLDGRLGEICQARLGNFPLAYSWGHLVSAAGALIPRSNAPVRPNVNFCPVGPTGTGKSQSGESTQRVLGMWPSHRVLLKGKYGSAEGLIEKLQDVEPDAVRLVYVDELGHLMSKAAIERSSFPYVLNSAYYEDEHSGGTKGRQFHINCRLSIVGGVVEELFGDSFGMATTGGLYDRFIFGLCPQPFQFLYRPFEGCPEPMDPLPAAVSPDVWEVRDEWVLKLGIASRVSENALRVAYICASVDGRPNLRGDDLGPALAFAKYQMRVRKVLQPNPGENADAKCAVAIRGWLSDHAEDGSWISQRELDRGIHSSRMGPGVFIRCLNNLQLNDEIELDLKRRMLRRIP